MPYANINDLPSRVKDHLPEHAQHIYMKAFNSAYKEYQQPGKRQAGRDPEETAHAVAWSAVEHEYEKGPDGDWHKK